MNVTDIVDYKAQRRRERWAQHIERGRESSRRIQQARDELAAALRAVRRRGPEGRAQAWAMLDQALATGEWRLPPVPMERVK